MGVIKNLILTALRGTALLGYLREYVASYFHKVRMETRGEMAETLSKVATYVLIFLLALLADIFFNIALALYINTLFVGHPYVGFCAVALLYLLKFFLLFALRSKLSSEVRRRVMESMKNETH